MLLLRAEALPRKYFGARCRRSVRSRLAALAARPRLEWQTGVVPSAVHLDVQQFSVAAVVGAHGVAQHRHRIALTVWRAGPVLVVVAAAAAQSVTVLATVLDERHKTCAACPALGASESVGVDHAVNYGVDCSLVQP